MFFQEVSNGPSAGWGKVFALKDPYTMAALNANNGSEDLFGNPEVNSGGDSQ